MNTIKSRAPGSAIAQHFRIPFGASLGTGMEMIVEKDINAYAQVKYMLSKYQQLVISIGVLYYFDGRRFRKW